MTEQEGQINMKELYDRLVARNNELKQSTAQTPSLQDKMDKLIEKKVKEELVVNQYLEFVNKQPPGTSKAKLNILACKEHPDIIKYMFDNNLIVVEHMLLCQLALNENNAPLVRFFLFEKGIRFLGTNPGQMNVPVQLFEQERYEMFDVIVEEVRNSRKDPLLQGIRDLAYKRKLTKYIKLVIEEYVKYPGRSAGCYNLDQIIDIEDVPLLEWYISIMGEMGYNNWYTTLDKASRCADPKIFELCKKLPRKGYADFLLCCYDNPKLHDFLWEIRDSIEFFHTNQYGGVDYQRHRKNLMSTLSGSYEKAIYVHDTWLPYLDKKFDYKPNIDNLAKYFNQ